MKKNIITFSKSGASSSKIRNIKWNAESNLDNFTKSGQYYITGYRASGTDSLPISNIGEWHNISALLTVTDSGEADTQQRNRIVGQTLILSNRVGGETKIFTRSCNMVSGGGLWTAWSTVQGLREVGGVSPVDIASYTDSGLYSGAIIDSELSTMPMMPGTTFLLVVINNSQLASLSGSSQVRACTQLMYVLPYSQNASLDGISEGSIYLRTGMRSATTGIYEWGDWNSYDNRLQLIEKQLAELNLSGDVKGVISDDGSIVTSINPQAPIMQEITMVLNILLEAHDGSDNIKSTMRQYVGTAVSEMVDEEDITIDEDNLLRLKNRSYSKGVGMGYVILRRGKSFASQVTAANTIYEIRYDFDLAGEEVAIPEGCTLKFEGGRLMNGTVIGHNTEISSARNLIFSKITLSGAWKVLDIYSEWFDFSTLDDVDNIINFRNLIALTDAGLQNNIYLADGTYYTQKNGGLLQLKSNTQFFMAGTIKIMPNSDARESVILVHNAANVGIYGGTIIGDIESHVTNENSTDEWNHGIKISGSSSNVTIKGVTILKQHGDGIDIIDDYKAVTSPAFITIDSVIIDKNGRNGISIESGHDIVIRNSVISGTSEIKDISPGLAIDIEPWIETADVYNILIEDCTLNNPKGFDKYDIALQPNISKENKDFKNNITLRRCKARGIGIFSANGVNIEICFVENMGLHNALNTTFADCSVSVDFNLHNGNNVIIRGCNVNTLNFNEPVYDVKVENSVFSGSFNSWVAENIKITGSTMASVNIQNTINFLAENSKITAPVITSGDNIIISKCDVILKGLFVPYNNSVTNLVFKDNRISFEEYNENVQFYGAAIWDGNIITSGVKLQVRAESKFYRNIFVYLSEQAAEGFIILQLANATFELIDNHFHNVTSVFALWTSSEVIYNSKELIAPTTNLSGFKPLDGCLAMYMGIPYIYVNNVWFALALMASGVSSARPTNIARGTLYFDSTLVKPIWWSDSEWVDANGFNADLARGGTTSERPHLSSTDCGFIFYDTTLEKPIIWNGTKWCYMDGTKLS